MAIVTMKSICGAGRVEEEEEEEEETITVLLHSLTAAGIVVPLLPG